MIGALVGFALAVMDYHMYGIAMRNRTGNAADPRNRVILDRIRKALLIVFPIIGWFLGPLAAQNYGVP